MRTNYAIHRHTKIRKFEIILLFSDLWGTVSPIRETKTQSACMNIILSLCEISSRRRKVC